MLKAVLETLEGVDDAVKSFYTESDGKFVLAVEGVDDHPEVANLRNAYTRTKEDREKAKGETATLKAQIAELQKGAPDTAATQAKLTQLQEQLDAKIAEATDWQGKYVGVTRDQTLQQALQAAGITNPTFVKAATTMLSGKVKIGEDGTVYAETPMGPKMVNDFVKSWAAGEGKDFVAPPSGGGAGGSKGGGASQKKPEEMSVQERGQLLKDDPDAFYKAFPHAKLR
jgi:hypothetical protein